MVNARTVGIFILPQASYYHKEKFRINEDEQWIRIYADVLKYNCKIRIIDRLGDGSIMIETYVEE